jgi:transcriptional regulator with XRE-family HTH domain
MTTFNAGEKKGSGQAMSGLQSREGALEVSFGAVVKAWRESRGWSLTEFAERADLRKGHVSEIEKGKIERPSRSTLKKLAAGLGISEWDLYTRQLPEAETGGSGGFGFAAPIRVARRAQDRDEQLRRMSRLVDELRSSLDELLSAEGGGGGRAS